MDELDAKNARPRKAAPHEPTGRSNQMAGGFFIAIGLLVGAVVGVAYGQGSAGMIGGFVIGSIIALAIWALDSRK